MPLHDDSFDPAHPLALASMPLELPPPVQSIPLGSSWLAVVLADGAVVLQHRKAFIMGTGRVIDLNDLQGPNADFIQSRLEEYGNGRILIRTILLTPDGSVSADKKAISPGGIPSGESFVVFDNARESAAWYAQANKSNYEHSDSGSTFS